MNYITTSSLIACFDWKIKNNCFKTINTHEKFSAKLIANVKLLTPILSRKSWRETMFFFSIASEINWILWTEWNGINHLMHPDWKKKPRKGCYYDYYFYYLCEIQLVGSVESAKRIVRLCNAPKADANEK